MRVKAKLWSHQQQVVDFVMDAFQQEPRIALCLAGCATGKTLVALKLAELLSVSSVLILTTKAGITSAWLKEYEKWCDGANVIAPLRGTTKAKAKRLTADTDPAKVNIFVINYESAWRISKEISDYGFDLVVADESHKLQAHNSSVSKYLARACSGITYKLAMTGTAWDDRPSQLYGQCRWLYPGPVRGGRISSGHFGSWTNWREEYEVTRDLGDRRLITVGFKNHEKLLHKINDFTVRVDSEEVLDLPPFHHVERRVTLSPKYAKIYKDMMKHWIAELGDEVLTADNRLTLGIRLHQLSRGWFDGAGWISKPESNPCLAELMGIIDELGGEPAVIFTRFSTDVEAIAGVLAKAGHKVKFLVGGRHEHVEFQGGQGDILIANISAGAEAVELTRSRYAIYYSKGFSRTQYNQSLYRIRRPGSERPVTYFHIVCGGTVDMDIERAMRGKGEVADYLLSQIQSTIGG